MSETTLKKYTVTIQRNQIAEADIEVEAENESEAKEKALLMADDSYAKFDEVDYIYDVIDIDTDEEE